MGARRTEPMLAVAISALLIWVALTCSAGLAQQPDPLPFWAEGSTRSAIIRFVHELTHEEDSKYVRPEARIATFDNDGTLWCEQPVGQLEFVTYRIKQMAAEHPQWKDQDPCKAVLAGYAPIFSEKRLSSRLGRYRGW